VLKITQFYSVVRDTLEPQHRLIDATGHLEVAVVVAGVYQQEEQVRSQIHSELRLQFLKHLSELVQPEVLLSFLLLSKGQAPHIDPANVHDLSLTGVDGEFYCPVYLTTNFLAFSQVKRFHNTVDVCDRWICKQSLIKLGHYAVLVLALIGKQQRVELDIRATSVCLSDVLLC